jgi:glutathione S-transferase
MELEDGTLIQDSTDIIPHYEDAHPDDPLIPQTPVLKALDLLLGYFGSESFFTPAMHYRWNYFDQHAALWRLHPVTLCRMPATWRRSAGKWRR